MVIDGKDLDGFGTVDAGIVGTISYWKDLSSNAGDFTSSGDPTQTSSGATNFDGSLSALL